MEKNYSPIEKLFPISMVPFIKNKYEYLTIQQPGSCQFGGNIDIVKIIYIIK